MQALSSRSDDPRPSDWLEHAGGGAPKPTHLRCSSYPPSGRYRKDTGPPSWPENLTKFVPEAQRMGLDARRDADFPPEL